MSDWNPRVNEIFLNALAKGHDYHAYLDTACRSDTDLRRAVEIMLAAHEQAGSFLERPALALTATDNLPPLPVEAISESESAGNRLGPYQLLQKLGEGGMGTVWLASQEEPVRRQVALKIIRSGMDSRQVLTRFAHER